MKTGGRIAFFQVPIPLTKKWVSVWPSRKKKKRKRRIGNEESKISKLVLEETERGKNEDRF